MEGQGKYQFRFQRINPYPPSYTRHHDLDVNNNIAVNATVNNTIDSWFSAVEQIYVDGIIELDTGSMNLLPILQTLVI